MFTFLKVCNPLWHFHTQCAKCHLFWVDKNRARQLLYEVSRSEGIFQWSVVSDQWTDGYRNNSGTRARGLGPREAPRSARCRDINPKRICDIHLRCAICVPRDMPCGALGCISYRLFMQNKHGERRAGACSRRETSQMRIKPFGYLCRGGALLLPMKMRRK